MPVTSIMAQDSGLLGTAVINIMNNNMQITVFSIVCHFYALNVFKMTLIQMTSGPLKVRCEVLTDVIYLLARLFYVSTTFTISH